MTVTDVPAGRDKPICLKLTVPPADYNRFRAAVALSGKTIGRVIREFVAAYGAGVSIVQPAEQAKA